MKELKPADRPRPAPRNAKGVALVFALMGITILSMLAASLLYVSSAETYASLNYKRQVQAVYASTAGVQRALDWFRTTYSPYLDNQATGVVDTKAYTTTGLVPLYSGQQVTLGEPTDPSLPNNNFPNGTIIGSFSGIKTGSTTIGDATAGYRLWARLLSHGRFVDITGINTVISERWQIGVTGAVSGVLNSYSVQETAIIEDFFIPIYKDAVRGACNVNINGNLTTDSFNSNKGTYDPCTCPGQTCNSGCATWTGVTCTGNCYTGADAQASVGSNAILDLAGKSIIINGNAYYGQAYGACTGTDKIPTNDVKGDITQSPPVPFPPITPTFTTTTGGEDVCGNGTSKAAGPTWIDASKQPHWSYRPNAVGTYYGNCKAASGDAVTLCIPSGATTPATYFFTDMIIGGGSAQLEIRQGNNLGICDSTSKLCNAAGVTCYPPGVKLYISNSLSLGGNGLAGSGDPKLLSVLLTATNTSSTCGKSSCSYTGTNSFYGTIYAPNAGCCISGNSNFYGAVSAYNVDTGASVNVHYDLSMQYLAGTTTTFRVVNQTRNVF